MFGDLEESSQYDLDKRGAASVKKILLHRIIFKEAQKSDQGDMLHLKYKPLNANYKPGKMKTHQTQSVVSDLPKPAVVLYAENRIEVVWKEVKRIGPGLANLGNTCFLNSVLQVLTYTAPLVNYILTGHHKNNCKAVGFCMQCELANHIVRVVRHNNQGALKPLSIIQKLNCIGKNFRFGRQEDAHEFLRFVVEAIQKSEYFGRPKLDKVSKETTVANAIFGGYYRSQVKCLQCHHESNTYDPMMDINLDIKDCSSIMHALKKTVLPDRLDGDNKYFCERCRKKTVAQKRGSIHKEPNVLTLQLKRFDFSRMFGGKISKEVYFPEDLNIRPFMSCTKSEPMMYKLYGVLVHSGYSCNSGHYYCYVKASNGLWFEMNDNRVTQVSMKTVLSAQAYLLFYVKAKKHSSKPHPPTNQMTAKNVHQKNTPIKQVQTNVLYGPQKTVGPQKPDVRTLNQNIKLDSSNESPYGIPLKRKPEAKIVFNIPMKQKLGQSEAPKNPFFSTKKSETDSDREIGTTLTSTPHKQNAASTSTPSKQSTPSTSTHSKQSTSQTEKENLQRKKAATVSKEPQKPSLNSLQRLSESYGDTDSSAPSSPSQTVPSSVTPQNTSHNSTNEFKDSTSVSNEQTVSQGDKSNLKLPLDTSSTSTNSNKENASNKVKKLKAHHLNRSSIWSPVTKGVLHPRVIINRHLPSDNNEATGKQAKEEAIRTETSSPVLPTFKMESTTHNGRMFGPMMPPPPVSIPRRHRNNSITSEASSVHSQSGDWDIEEKELDNRVRHLTDGLQEQRQHVGWNVSTSDQTSLHEKKSKKKKKKKKRMSSSQPSSPISSDDNETSSKRRDHDRSLKRSHPDDDSSNRDDIPKKKKKKNKRHDVSDEENVSDDLNSSSSKKKKKKKKKKHKKHRHDGDEGEDSPKHHINTSYSDDRNKHTGHSSSYLNDSSLIKSSESEISLDRSKIFTSAKRLSGNSEDATFKVKKYNDNYTSTNDDDIERGASMQKNKHKHKDVPVHMWDEEKKKICIWDGAIKAKAIDQLLNSSTKVSSWSGDDNTNLYSLKNTETKERTQDEWDEEYDAGKTKKIKKSRRDQDDGGKYDGVNIFQEFQNQRNVGKDNKPSFQHPSFKHGHDRHHHQHKKHGHTHRKDLHRPKHVKKVC